MEARGQCAVYACMCVLLCLQLAVSYYLLCYVQRVEQRCCPGDVVRVRRSVLEDNAVSSEATVEFFDPKMRQELEERDQQNKGSANTPWVWLNSYSRVPVSLTISIISISDTLKDVVTQKLIRCRTGPARWNNLKILLKSLPECIKKFIYALIEIIIKRVKLLTHYYMKL